MNTPTIHHEDDEVTVYHGDCLDVLRALPDASVDSVVTDPPYGLSNTDPANVAETITRWVGGERDYLPGGSGFMGKDWDAFVPPVAVWDECLRVLKPGGHVLAFAGSRTMDLMTLGLRLAGFDIRDSVAWLYGSGFPKSMDVSKAIDKAAGAERTDRAGVKPGHEDFVGRDNMKALRESGALSQEGGYSRPWMFDPEKVEATHYRMAPATIEAERWEGWGTALKPAFEPVVVARKPLIGSVAANVLTHGTGALNIDGCRVGDGSESRERVGEPSQETRYTNEGGTNFAALPGVRGGSPAGRWPSNVVLDESQAAELDRQAPDAGAGGQASGKTRTGLHESDSRAGAFLGTAEPAPFYGDSGGASRFFYVAKAPSKERPRVDGVAHPTVKPLALMRWLVRLVTPPGGKVLEPFAGSGTTVEACIAEGFRCVAIEQGDEYLPLIDFRIKRRGIIPDDPKPAPVVDDDDELVFDFLPGGAR